MLALAATFAASAAFATAQPSVREAVQRSLAVLLGAPREQAPPSPPRPAAYPNGSFAVDARFNRALCLVRLGRRDQARVALRPFAEAPVGSYRQQEAASLLLSLDGTAQ